MSEFNQALQTYIQKVLSLQKEKSESVLSVEELNQVAEELGLSAEDLDYIDQKFEDFLERGKGFMRYQQWQRATDELSQAIMLKPLHIEALSNIAEAYFKLWQKTAKKHFRTEARRYAERCLKVDPRQELCLYIISQLDKKSPRYQQRKSAYVRLALIILAVLLLSLAIYVTYLWLRPSKPSLPSGETTTVLPPAKIPSKLRDIPLQVAPQNAKEGFTLWVEQSLLDTKKQQYSLRACLSNSKYDLNALALRLEILGLNGQVLLSQSLIKPEESPDELLQNDALPLVSLLEVSADARAARVVVSTADKLPPQKPDTFPVELIWECTRPAGVELEVLERYQLIQPEADFFNHELQLAFQNKGKASLKILKAELRWYDLRRQLIHAEALEMLTLLQPRLPQRQVRTWQGDFLIDHKRSDYRKYKIAITEVVAE